MNSFSFVELLSLAPAVFIHRTTSLMQSFIKRLLIGPIQENDHNYLKEGELLRSPIKEVDRQRLRMIKDAFYFIHFVTVCQISISRAYQVPVSKNCETFEIEHQPNKATHPRTRPSFYLASIAGHLQKRCQISQSDILKCDK